MKKTGNASALHKNLGNETNLTKKSELGFASNNSNKGILKNTDNILSYGHKVNIALTNHLLNLGNQEKHTNIHHVTGSDNLKYYSDFGRIYQPNNVLQTKVSEEIFYDEGGKPYTRGTAKFGQKEDPPHSTFNESENEYKRVQLNTANPTMAKSHGAIFEQSLYIFFCKKK